jgi:hypothetical protein
MRFMAVLSSYEGVWDAAERDARVGVDVDDVPDEGAADAGASVGDEAVVRVPSSTAAEERAGAAAAFSVAPLRGVVELRLVAI